MDLIAALQHILNSLGFHLTVAAVIALFGLAFARTATAMSLTPFLGGKAISSNVKVGLAIIVTAVLFPGLSAKQANAPDGPVLFIALLAKEAMIGAIIGFLAQLIFFGVQMAGALIDAQRGMDHPGLFAPQLASNVSIIGQLKFQTAIVLFLFMNGHLLFLRALARSFEQLPILDFPRFSAGSLAAAEQTARISGQVFVVALQLSAPILVTLFLVDVLFGAIGKVASQINVHQESQPVKSFLGLVLLLLAIGFILTRMENALSRTIWNIYSVVSGFA